MAHVDADGTRVEITNPDKQLLPGVSKLELVRYYAAVWPQMKPFLRNRPITIERLPDGLGGQHFWQKNRATEWPEYVEGASLPGGGLLGTRYPVINRPAALFFLVNQGAVVFHTMLCTRDGGLPDKIVWDLDPPAYGLNTVGEGALYIRDHLQTYGIQSWVMKTGSKGLHVVVPIARTYQWSHTKAFAIKVGEALVRAHPTKFTMEGRKEFRGDKTYVDIERNNYGQTVVVPFSARATQQATVAVPVHWSEIESGLFPTTRTVHNRLLWYPGYSDPVGLIRPQVIPR